jgi:hypothetical protein
MAHPSVQKKWVVMGQGKGLDEYNFTDGPVPSVGEYGVLVKLHAAALNYRDFLIPKPVVRSITHYDLLYEIGYTFPLLTCNPRAVIYFMSIFLSLADPMELAK